MASIIGQSQLKYFSEYVQDNSIQCLFSSGCTVEELATFPSVKEAEPAASVSIQKKYLLIYLLFMYLFIFTRMREAEKIQHYH